MVEIKIIKESISKEELQKFAAETFGDMVKVVADVERGIMAVGAEFHAEEEAMLIEREGSKREHAWGFNIYPEKLESEWIEFDSMVNIKPALGNRSRAISDEVVKEKIRNIVKELVKD